MTNETKAKIENLLFTVMDYANNQPTFEAKKEFYLNFLKNNLPFLPDVKDDINFNDGEIEEFIIDRFLSISKETPKVFEDEGYTPWLQDNRKNIKREFYDRYEKYLLRDKKWLPKSISDLKKSSDIILDHIANPKSDKYFDKKGLVIGDIQSGKTANYTALINKAIDAGYKIVIVLAGLTRDLRNQTQNRLDSEVLGYQTKFSKKGDNIGVGKIRQLHVEGLTCSDDEKSYGDLKRVFSTSTLDEALNPIVAIVKKNSNVLEHLDKFLTTSQEHCYENGKLKIPVLIIDDEVDQASVDTKNSKSLENASTINKKIRTILSHLNRYSYVGYTATPFANVFIDPDKDDLYPKDFILVLPTNDGYCGIKEYFGVDIIDEDENVSDHINDLFINIDDFYTFLNKNEKLNASTEISHLNNSLKDAIKSFIISASIKKARDIQGHNSMLIHIARYKNPSNTLKPYVSDYVDELYHNFKYKYENTVKEFKDFWNKNFKPVSKKRLAEKFNDDWKKIEVHLLSTIESIQTNIKVLNGDSEDVLDYSSTSSGDYIVIGGDKLSRGLTLEGLVVSYYYRKSKTYDSLLQMGRWFGYRKGWIDVCRVYSTVEFINDFITVGKVMQRFKSDIDDMYKQNLNPRQVGQRIMYSPNLIPTARNKMKSSTKIKISFSNSLQQVITFDRKFVKSNLELTNEFISSLGEGIIRNKKVVFKNISVDKVLEYLEKYKDCKSYYGYGHISVANWIRYIKNLNENGELSNWTIVLNSLQSANEYKNAINIAGHEIIKPTRSLRDAGNSSTFDFYTVRTIVDPLDFKEIFDPESNDYKNVEYFSPKQDYIGFDYNCGLLSIYVMDLYEKEVIEDEFDNKTNKFKTKRGKIVEDGQSVCAPAIWFPKAKDYKKSATEYFVSKDYLDLRNKDLEEDDIEEEENA